MFSTELDKGVEFVSALGIQSHSWGLAAELGANSTPVQPRVTLVITPFGVVWGDWGQGA